MTKDDITDILNKQHQWLRYEGMADYRGFGVDRLLHRKNLNNDDVSIFAHRWYSAGVEAAYLAVKDRSDVPEDIKHGLASYAGLVHGSQR